MRENMKRFESLYEKVRELNRNNENLRSKYKGDTKYARTHKRLREKNLLSSKDSDIYQILINTKGKIDGAVQNSENIVDSKGYFSDLVMNKTVTSFDEAKTKVTFDAAKVIQSQLSREYINEYNGVLI